MMKPNKLYLPREKEHTSKNSTPKFHDGALVVDLEFMHYRKIVDELLGEIVKMQNYVNYQAVFLSHNPNDILQYVLNTTNHVSILHTSIE